MKILEFLKANLRETLLKGIEETIDSLKELLPKSSEKYQSLILIQSQLLETKRKMMHGTISEADAQLSKNRLRESLMELINSLEPTDMETPAETPPAAEPPPPPPPAEPKKVVEKRVSKQAPKAEADTTDKSKWAARITKEKDLEWLEFDVTLTEGTHQVIYYLEGTTSLLKVDGHIVFRETLNLLNTVTSILNFLTVNEESIDFEIEDGSRHLPCRLSLGVSVKNSNYKRIKLFVDGKLLYGR